VLSETHFCGEGSPERFMFLCKLLTDEFPIHILAHRGRFSENILFTLAAFLPSDSVPNILALCISMKKRYIIY
jgi:hypothetical protein